MGRTASESELPRPSLLSNGRFLLLWAAYGVSAVGDHISELAILKSQGAASAAVDVTPLDARMTFLFFLPFFLIGPLAGCLADRLPRRGLMIAADLVRCLILLLFGALMSMTQDWTVWGPFLPLVLVGLFAAVFSPARLALLPTLVRPDQLVRANGMISGLGIVATMLALFVGGYLAKHFEPKVAFRIDAATYLTSALLLGMLRPPSRPDAGAFRRGIADFYRDVMQGFRYTATHRRVIELILIAALIWFCGALIKCVIPAVVRDAYAGDIQDIGRFRVFWGAGIVLGSVTIALLGQALRSEIAITWGLVGVSAAIALFTSTVFLGMAPATLYWIGAAGMVGIGVFGVSILVGLDTLMQRIVPDQFRGRVFGVKDLFATAALLAATGTLGLPSGARVDTWVGHILFGVALLTLSAGIATLIVRARRSPVPAMTMLAEHINEFIAKVWWRLTYRDRWRIPAGRGVIVTANHSCSADPLFLCAASPHRIISFLVAAEYTRWPVFGYVMSLADCIPVRRGEADTGAAKEVIRLLRSGKTVGIFIEGQIVPEGQKVEPKDGVAMMALRTGAVVVPAHISGVVRTRSIFRGLLARHRARVRFGTPVDLSEFSQDKPDRDDVRNATRRIHAAILALAPPGEQPPASEPTYEPA